MQDTANYINERKRESDSINKIVEIQNKLTYEGKISANKLDFLKDLLQSKREDVLAIVVDWENREQGTQNQGVHKQGEIKNPSRNESNETLEKRSEENEMLKKK